MADLNARIKPKKSSTTGEVPQAADLEVAEIAVNTADGKLFVKHTDNSIKEISGGTDITTESIDALSDVDTSTTPPVDGQVLTYVTTPASFPSGEFIVTAAGGLIEDISSNTLTINNFGVGVANDGVTGDCLDFSTSSGAYCSSSDNAAFHFGSGDFTIEFSFKYTAGGSTSYMLPVTKTSANTVAATDFSVVLQSDTGNLGLSLSDGSSRPFMSHAFGTRTEGVWYHVAIVRSGNTITFYKDGTSIGSSTYSSTVQSTSASLRLGATYSLSSGNFKLDNFRISKTAVYTSSFTPPTDFAYQPEFSQWEPVNAAAGGATTIDELTDVDTSTTPPTDGQVLTWDNVNSKWEPADAPTGAVELNDLGDVSVSAAGPTFANDLSPNSFTNTADSWSAAPSGPNDWILVSSTVDGVDISDWLNSWVSGDMIEYYNANTGDLITSYAFVARDLTFGAPPALLRMTFRGTNGSTEYDTLQAYSGPLTIVNTARPYTIGAPSDGQVLTYVAANGKWESVDSVTTIDDLTDVDTSTVAPTHGQVLAWDNSVSQWEPLTLPAGVSAINDLTDVDTATSAPTDGQTLKWVDANSKWEPADESVETLFPLDCSATDAEVVFVLHGDEADGTTSLTDPVNGIQFFGVNTAATTTSISKFGAGCLNTTLARYFEESNSDARTILQDKDWGIDFWYNRDSGDTSTQDEIFCSHASSKFSNVSWHWVYRPLTPDLQFIYTTNGSTQITTEFALGAALTQDTWHHISISREGTTLRAFVNGVQVDTDKTIANDSFYVYNSWGMAIGGARGGTTPCRGYIDEFRMKVGAPGYTAAFTPPAAPYADTTSACVPGAPANGQILEYSSANSAWLGVDYISKATLQAEVAASTDFANFQARIAAL